MLYDGAIKFCNIAIVAIEEKDINKAHQNIMKVENIIQEFQATLIHAQNGPPLHGRSPPAYGIQGHQYLKEPLPGHVPEHNHLSI